MSKQFLTTFHPFLKELPLHIGLDSCHGASNRTAWRASNPCASCGKISEKAYFNRTIRSEAKQIIVARSRY